MGVASIAAEAELLAAICLFLQRVGLGPADVAIKVSSRGVLGAVLTRYGIPADAVGPVAVVVDKMDKLPLAKARGLLLGPGLHPPGPGLACSSCHHACGRAAAPDARLGRECLPGTFLRPLRPGVLFFCSCQF